MASRSFSICLERQPHTVVNSRDSEERLPRFEFQLCHLLAMWPRGKLLIHALITSCVNGDSVTTTYFIGLLWELRLTFYSAYNSTWLFKCLLNSNKTTTHQSMPSMSIDQSWCPNWNPFVISILVGTLYTHWYLHTLKRKCSETSGFVCLVHCCVPNVSYIEDAPSVSTDWRHSPYTYSE